MKQTIAILCLLFCLNVSASNDTTQIKKPIKVETKQEKPRIVWQLVKLAGAILLVFVTIDATKK